MGPAGQAELEVLLADGGPDEDEPAATASATAGGGGWDESGGSEDAGPVAGGASASAAAAAAFFRGGGALRAVFASVAGEFDAMAAAHGAADAAEYNGNDAFFLGLTSAAITARGLALQKTVLFLAERRPLLRATATAPDEPPPAAAATAGDPPPAEGVGGEGAAAAEEEPVAAAAAAASVGVLRRVLGCPYRRFEGPGMELELRTGVGGGFPWGDVARARATVDLGSWRPGGLGPVALAAMKRVRRDEGRE